MSKFIREPEGKIPVIEDVDVVVVGGGPSGLAASLASARCGAKTLLIERYGFWGGMMTAGLVLTIGGYNSWLKPYSRVLGGIPQEILTRMKERGGAEDNQSWVLSFDPEVFKLVADELVESAGIIPLLHTFAVNTLVDERVIEAVIMESKSGREAIAGKVFVDATGDADIAFRSGVDCSISDKLQPMTLCFVLRNVADETAGVKKIALWDLARPVLLRGDKLLTDDISRRKLAGINREDMKKKAQNNELPLFLGPCFGGLEEREIWVNTTRLPGNGTSNRDLTKAEITGRKNISVLVSYFRRNVPQLRNCRILTTGSQVGIRETRQIVGEYTLTGEDIKKSRSFEDSIARGCWPIDVHPVTYPVGVHDLFVPRPYQIPFRCLVPRGIDNLLVTGRCISAEQEAMGSTRVMATCMALGEAAGTAAALAVKRNIAIRQINTELLQRRLREQGAIIGLAE